MGKDICSRIKAILAERGIKLMDFYRDSGITSAAFSLWNTGKTAPSRKSLERICKYLGCKVSDLTDDDYYGVLVLRGESKVALPEAVLTKTPATADGDGLSDEDMEIVELLMQIAPEDKQTVLALLKSLAAQHEAPPSAAR